MQKTAITTIVFVAVLSLTACKQKKEEYQISPIGYWRGTESGVKTAILNRENGSSRFYMRIPGIDTANSGLKVEGTYKHTDDAFKGTYPNDDDTVAVECTFVSDQSMFGFMTLVSAEPVSIDLERQP